VTSDKDLLARAVRNPGRFILGPTQTTGGGTYGGVSLGFHRDGEAVWRSDYVQVRDPASGRIVEIGRNGADYPEVYALVDGPSWDEDMLQGIFARFTRPSQNAVPTPAETRIDGTIIPSNVLAWPPILFAADDPAHKSIYFRRPLPTLSLRQGVALSQALRAGLPVRFIPSPDSAWVTVPDYQIARIENIVL